MRFWARPSWEWSYIWAIVVLALPSVGLAFMNWRNEDSAKRRWLLGLVQGPTTAGRHRRRRSCCGRTRSGGRCSQS